MEKEQLQELIENNKEDIFSEIKDEISDDTVTDIEWDGYNLWITQLGRGCYISMKELSDKYMDNLSIRLANIMGASFNRMHPILEANTESLRISIWHQESLDLGMVTLLSLIMLLRVLLHCLRIV